MNPRQTFQVLRNTPKANAFVWDKSFRIIEFPCAEVNGKGGLDLLTGTTAEGLSSTAVVVVDWLRNAVGDDGSTETVDFTEVEETEGLSLVEGAVLLLLLFVVKISGVLDGFAGTWVSDCSNDGEGGSNC